LIGEFQKLTEVSKNKFKIFENSQHRLQDEINNLKIINEELKEKINEMAQRDYEKDQIIQELKNTRENYDRIYEEQKVDLLKKEEKLRNKLEEREKELKNKLLEKEEILKDEYIEEIKNLNRHMEAIKSENDKLKFDIIDLKSILDDYENSKHEREIEFKREIILRDNEYEKQQKFIRQLHEEIEELEEKISEKTNDFSNKIRNTEQNENKYLQQINLKEKKIKESEDEINNLKNLIVDLQCSKRDLEIKIENKNNLLDQIKLKNEEKEKEIKNIENEMAEMQQLNMKELEIITHKFSDLTNDKENLLLENDDLKAALIKATTRIRELNEIIEIKYQNIEIQLVKEKTNKENIERKYKDLQRKYNLNYDSLVNENSELRNNLEKQSIDMDNMITKFENKIQKVKKKLKNFKSI
jgi:hypothetical protein